jgi:predicted AlkP superfamily pyrophosphatase or phosphodiesterase
MKRSWFFLFVAGLWIFAACAAVRTTASGTAESPPTVLLISMDGFRADYLDRFHTPHLHAFAADGVRAEALIPSYPTVTFPNHYTIVTGLYPEHHGIVANEMYDPRTGHHFDIKDDAAVSSSEWWGGEPIWVTAEKQKKVAATLFWVGSSAEIKGVRPTYWRPYDKTLSVEKRLQQVYEWLALPTGKRPQLITLYFEEPDAAGHAAGPESDLVRQAVERMDATFGQLWEELGARKLRDQLNIVLVSDHGMADVPADHGIAIGPALGNDAAEIAGGTAFLSVFPKDGAEARLYARLKKFHPHLKVFRKSEIPERFHFRDSARISPLFVVADEGWAIKKTTGGNAKAGGAHGYDNASTQMRGIFLAAGPAFRKGITVPAFGNIEVYNLLCRILRLTPSPNDGVFERVSGMFAP